MDKHQLIDRLLTTLENDIIPKTRRSVADGNKVFGAAILLKSDLSLVLAETNNETQNPLWHGEVNCLNAFYELPERPKTTDCIFLSTHEPCSMCLSAITWAGFDNFYYLFSYQDTKDEFSIPHDLNIMDQVFRLKEGEYRKTNAYWSAKHISSLIAKLPEEGQPALAARVQALHKSYAELSRTYQAAKAEGKNKNTIALA